MTPSVGTVAAVPVQLQDRAAPLETVRINMTEHLRGSALEMAAAVAEVDGMTAAQRRTFGAAIRRRFAEWRPAVGLQARPVPLLLQGSGNVKIGRNVARTLTYTGSPSTSARVVFSMASGKRRRVVMDSCPWSGSCAACCVLRGGNARYSTVSAGRTWRTLCAYVDPVGWAALRRVELVAAANRHGAILERGDVGTEYGMSDWLPSLYADTPEGAAVRGYDYGKRPNILGGDGWAADGHHRTAYSWNESSNARRVARFLERGGTVAMVTDTRKGENVPSAVDIAGTWWPTVDGDVTDDRYNDPESVVVVLRAKGAAVVRGRRSALVRGRLVQLLHYV